MLLKPVFLCLPVILAWTNRDQLPCDKGQHCDGGFCNMANQYDTLRTHLGTCEKCCNFNEMSDCYNDGLQPLGALNCLQRCIWEGVGDDDDCASGVQCHSNEECPNYYNYNMGDMDVSNRDFCNYDDGTGGNCQSCENFKTKDDCSMYGFELQGEESCIDTCTKGPECTGDNECPSSETFCNWDKKWWGHCESCENYTNENECKNNPEWASKGTQSCIENCVPVTTQAPTTRATTTQAPTTRAPVTQVTTTQEPEPVLIPCPVEKALKLDVFAQANSNIDASSIKSHGCHCSTYSGNVGGGSPVDDLDAACQAWNTKSRCLTLEGGACSNGIVFDAYNVQLNQDGSVNQDVEFGCAYVANDCEEALCRLGYEFALFLFGSVAEGGAGSYNWNGYNTNAECTPVASNGNEKVCIGDSPNVKIVSKN